MYSLSFYTALILRDILIAYFDVHSLNFSPFAAYIYIRGEFYNEASNLQVAINEVSYKSHIQ